MTDPREVQAEIVAMNEALILSSLRQHELTEAAEALNDQLREEMDKRSALEATAQQQAIKLAELDRHKDEFLAMLGHELRSPLAAISNAAQLLGLERDEPEVHRKGRAVIERQVAHLAHLVQEMLDVSRITTHKIQLRMGPVVWNDVIERAVATALPLLNEHGHQLDVTLSAEPIHLAADAARLELVVVNLLTNAAKYSNDGGRISISVEETDGWSVLRVRDQGVGIAPELVEHIFDLFTQAERTLDRAEGGLGIGLYIVRRLVELHGGTISVSSEVGSGSEFTVRLPVHVPSPADTTRRPSTPVPANAADIVASSPFSARRVLVVDDDEDTAEGMAELIKAAGHDVRTVHDGPAALAAAADYQPNIVFMDIGLPMIDGYEVAKRMRADPALRDIILVAVTGYGQAKDRDRARAAGFDHHLVKPVELLAVKEIITTAPARAIPNSAHSR